jgi:phosphoribosylglycinamide formyltransferase-1
MQIAVLASGTGSLLEALLEADLPIAVVLVDRHCRAEEIAAKAGLPVVAVVREDFSSAFDRERFTSEVVTALAPFAVDLVVMAGYGTILAAPVHSAYPGRIVNTHPALLPAFKGWHAVEEALAAGVKVTGCTVHVAELEVDEGVILAQEAVPVLADDTVESLHERIKVVERKLYPETIRAALAVLEKGGSLA